MHNLRRAVKGKMFRNLAKTPTDLDSLNVNVLICSAKFNFS